jgi:hypothetical protein
MFGKKNENNTKQLQKKKSNDSIIKDFLHSASSAMDWMSVIEKQQIAEEVLDEYTAYIDWTAVCLYQNLREDFIESHLDKLKLENVIRNQNVSEAFISRHLSELTTNKLLGSCRHKLSNEFMSTNRSYINWDLAVIHQKINIDTLFSLMEDKDIKLNITSLCTFQDLTEDFIEKYFDKLDLEAIQKYQYLSYGFMRKHIDKFDEKLLRKYQSYVPYEELVNIDKTSDVKKVDASDSKDNKKEAK